MQMAMTQSSDFVMYSNLHRDLCGVESIVAMAVYEGDREDWVKLAIDSVLGQSYADFVLCVVIDGPITRGMRDMLVSIDKADGRIALFESQVNKGLAWCMNSVIEFTLSYGPKYFFRMDADDICFKGRLARQVRYMEKHANVGVLGSAIAEIDESGRQVGRRRVPKKHHEFTRLLPKRCLINHPTVVMRYSLFEQGFRYNAKLSNTQDYFLWVEMVSQGVIFANIDKPLLKFRRTKGFFKRRGFSKSVNEFRARVFAMRKLDRVSPGNLYYAVSVLFARMLPGPLLKLIYRIDRLALHFWVRNK